MQTNTINNSNTHFPCLELYCTNSQRLSLAHYSDMYGVSDDGSMPRFVDHWILVKPDYEHLFLADDIMKSLETFKITVVYKSEDHELIDGKSTFILSQYREIASIEFDMMLNNLVNELSSLGAEYEFWSCEILDEKGEGFEIIHP